MSVCSVVGVGVTAGDLGSLASLCVCVCVSVCDRVCGMGERYDSLCACVCTCMCVCTLLPSNKS